MSERAWRGAALALCAFLVAAALGAEHAAAQSFRLERFRSAERPDDAFAVRRMSPLGHLRFGANAVLDYANDPLVIRQTRGSREELQSVVDHQLTLKLDFSLALWDRALLLAGFDAPLLLDGPELRPSLGVPEADGAGFGDVSLGLRVRIWGEPSDRFALGAQAVVLLPTAGDSQNYRGEDAVSVRPELIAELRLAPVRITLNGGVLVRPEVELADHTVGSELVYGLAIGLPVHARIELLAELNGGFDFAHFGARTATGLEWLLGAKLNTRAGFTVGAAAGAGLTRGLGTPDVRALVQLGYLTPLRSRAEPVETAVDRDHDGVLDGADGCPDVAEDRDGTADDDGCPDSDNDGDGVSDVDDACASEAEDRDGYAEEDGCPDPDNDGDAILDSDDACPNEPGAPEARGCKLAVEERAVALEGIQFENNRDTILPQSYPVLEGVQRTLSEHPEIKKLRIEGHTDGVGAAAYNMRLSEGRTQAVVRWLTSHGTEQMRLEAWACGELHTIADDATAEGRAQNRRVEFSVIDPPPAAGAAPHAGCNRLR